MTDTPPPIGHNNPPEPTITEVLEERFAARLEEVELLAQRANEAPKIVNTDTDQQAVGAVIIAARKLAKALAADKSVEETPLKEKLAETRGFFDGPLDRLRAVQERLQARADAYVHRREAEARAAAQERARAAEAEAQRLAAEAEAARQAGALKEAARAEAKADQADDDAARATKDAGGKAADLVRSRGTVTASAKGGWDFNVTDWDAIPLEKLRPYLSHEVLSAAIRKLVALQKGETDLAGVEVFPKTKATFR